MRFLYKVVFAYFALVAFFYMVRDYVPDYFRGIVNYPLWGFFQLPHLKLLVLAAGFFIAFFLFYVLSVIARYVIYRRGGL